jgi:hypothetical protein
MQSNLRDNKTHVKDFDEGFPKRAEGRGLRYDLFLAVISPLLPHSSYFLKTRLALMPPNPKEFERAYVTLERRAVWGM